MAEPQPELLLPAQGRARNDTTQSCRLTPMTEKTANTPTFDYVIVGAGSAGCVLANRLSADGKHTVCVLEAGGKDTDPFIHIPAGFMKTLVNPKVNWLYRPSPASGPAAARIGAPRGKTLGGSSSINGHIYNRGQRADYDGWAQRGNRGWGYADVLPYFRAVGAQDRHRRRHLPRPRRQLHRDRHTLAPRAVRGLYRGRGRHGHSAQPGL